MGKKTERLKKRLQEFPGGLTTEARQRIERLEMQVVVLSKFATQVHQVVGTIERGEHPDDSEIAILGATLNKALHRARNDVNRLADPDDGGCCG